MKQQEQQESNEYQLEDLTVAKATEVKSGPIEDLTLEEAKTENVKGGRFVFSGVEREMKESGEKGGTDG